jgi:hypothetical protein
MFFDFFVFTSPALRAPHHAPESHFLSRRPPPAIWRRAYHHCLVFFFGVTRGTRGCYRVALSLTFGRERARPPLFAVPACHRLSFFVPTTTLYFGRPVKEEEEEKAITGQHRLFFFGVLVVFDPI